MFKSSIGLKLHFVSGLRAIMMLLRKIKCWNWKLYLCKSVNAMLLYINISYSHNFVFKWQAPQIFEKIFKIFVMKQRIIKHF